MYLVQKKRFDKEYGKNIQKTSGGYANIPVCFLFFCEKINIYVICIEGEKVPCYSDAMIKHGA